MQNQPNFGFGTAAAPQAAPTGFSFGTNTSTPASTSLFGTPAATTPAGGLFPSTATSATPSLFGTATTANQTFGTTATPSFGAAPNTNLSFGPISNTSLGFGNTTLSTAASLGSTTNTLAFGGTATLGVTQTTASGFGVNPSAPLSFGATSAPAPTFGGTSSVPPAFGPTSTAASTFGTASSVAPTFGAASSVTPTFGATSSATPNFGATSSATPNFGATSSATPNFGATSSATPNFGFGLITTSAPANTSLSFNVGATVTSTPTSNPTTVGLGGLATAQTKIVTTQKDVTPKDQPLPNEILQTVESFKEFVKQQKMHSSDIARCSVRDFRKVEQDINNMAQLLSEVEGQLQKNMQLAEKLKYDTANCLKDVEIAQRTQDTPPGLQYENTAPLKFFLNLADKFERDMQILKIQIEGADNYIKNYRSPHALTPQDLHLGMRRLHESFVALAGRLHSVHNQVESQKEAYLNTRKQLFNDHTNPFDALYNPTDQSFQQILSHPPKVATGPTPFSNLALGLTQSFGSQQNQSGISYSAPTTSAAAGFGNVGFNTSFGAQPPSSSLFGGSSFAQNPNSFQLQKPPTGNKRGKQ